MLEIEDAHNNDADHNNADHSIVLARELFLEENATPQNGSGTVGGNDRSRHSQMLGVCDCIDIGKLTCGFEDRTGVLGEFCFGQKLLFFDENDIDKANDAGEKECQFVGNIGAIFVQSFEHAVVCEGAQRIKDTVGNG